MSEGSSVSGLGIEEELFAEVLPPLDPGKVFSTKACLGDVVLTWVLNFAILNQLC